MGKFKVVITDREYETIDNEKRILSRIDADVFDYQYKDMDHILEVAKDADAIIVQYAKMPRELIAQLEKCRIICRYAIGYDGIDTQAATDHGIYVCNVNTYCQDEVATHALAMLLELARRVSKYDRWVRDGNWFRMPGRQHSLKEQTIGIISYGRIARLFAEKVKPLCSNIWAYDPYVDDETIRKGGVEPKSLDEIIENSDYISIHCPLTPETRHMFDKGAFRRMKNTASIINCGRGAVISEDALVWALENGEIHGAGLDVLEQEPPAPDNPLFRFDNVYLNPHTAWYSVEAQKVLQSTPAEDIVLALTGKVPKNVVNPEVLKKLGKA